MRLKNNAFSVFGPNARKATGRVAEETNNKHRPVIRRAARTGSPAGVAKVKRGSLQDLHGILDRTEYGVRTTDGELLLFRVSPVNLSVLSEQAAEDRIRGLTLFLEAEPNLEMLCVDAVENLSENKRFLEKRIQDEPNPYVKDILKKDRAFFASMEEGNRDGLSPSRDFFFLLRLPRNASSEKRTGIPERIRAIAKTASGCGLTVTPATPEEAETVLTRYFGIPVAGTAERDDGDANRHVYSYDGQSIPFADRITPTAMQFRTDRYQIGESVRCIWAIRGYPPTTSEQGLLSGLGDREGVTLHIYLRPVSASERNRLLQSAERQYKWKSASNHLQESVDGQENMKDLAALLSDRKQDNGSLLYCAVFLELNAEDDRALEDLKNAVQTELTRCRLTHDPLILRQDEGFRSVLPFGSNLFREEFERVLPAASVANLYPFRYSGKTDPHGLFIGRDKYGTNLIVDPDRRDADKTNSNVLILGNSGQGKSYLLKLLLVNAREAGKRVICVDPEGEYRTLTEALGGVYVDLLDGTNRINPLEVRNWSGDKPAGGGESTEETGRNAENRLSGHIAFLKDFFRAYRDFPEEQMDVIEMLLTDLYEETENGEPPTLEDLYRKAEREYASRRAEPDHEAAKTKRGRAGQTSPEPADGTLASRMTRKTKSAPDDGRTLYSESLLREVCLSLRSLCVGSESRYFNGQTVFRDEPLVCVGMKGIHACNRRLKDAILFNLFSYIHHRLVTDGNTVAILDELYLFLTNLVVLDYLRSAMKRVRKRDSAVWLASQNIEDFLLPGIREYTIPLFSIPAHQFLFYPGNVSPASIAEMLQLEPSEFAQIRSPERGTCLYRCGNERYLLQVHAPEYKQY